MVIEERYNNSMKLSISRSDAMQLYQMEMDVRHCACGVIKVDCHDTRLIPGVEVFHSFQSYSARLAACNVHYTAFASLYLIC